MDRVLLLLLLPLVGGVRLSEPMWAEVEWSGREYPDRADITGQMA